VDRISSIASSSACRVAYALKDLNEVILPSTQDPHVSKLIGAIPCFSDDFVVANEHAAHGYFTSCQGFFPLKNRYSIKVLKTSCGAYHAESNAHPFLVIFHGASIKSGQFSAKSLRILQATILM